MVFVTLHRVALQCIEEVSERERGGGVHTHTQKDTNTKINASRQENRIIVTFLYRMRVDTCIYYYMYHSMYYTVYIITNYLMNCWTAFKRDFLYIQRSDFFLLDAVDVWEL